MVGVTLNHYRVINALGSGRMGEVFLAVDTRLKRQVALNHPNIVTVFSVEQAGASAKRSIKPSPA